MAKSQKAKETIQVSRIRWVCSNDPKWLGKTALGHVVEQSRNTREEILDWRNFVKGFTDSFPPGKAAKARITVTIELL